MRLLVNLASWASLITGSLGILRIVADAVQSQTWRHCDYHNPLFEFLYIISPGIYLWITLAGLGLVFKRHWGRWVWIAGATIASLMQAVSSCAQWMSGNLSPSDATVAVCIIGLSVGGICLLTRQRVTALFH